MANITLKFKDLTTKQFIDKGRPGGSYSQTMRFEPGFVVIVDCYGGERAFPAADIVEVVKDADASARW